MSKFKKKELTENDINRALAEDVMLEYGISLELFVRLNKFFLAMFFKNYEYILDKTGIDNESENPYHQSTLKTIEGLLNMLEGLSENKSMPKIFNLN